MNIHADKIVITYNFTEQPPIKGKHFDNAENIEKQALNPAFSLNLGSHKRENSPPIVVVFAPVNDLNRLY